MSKYNCRVCEKETDNKYCSFDHYKLYRKQQIRFIPCEACNRPIRKFNSQQKRFCSTRCAQSKFGEKTSGNKHWNWKGGKATFRGENWKYQAELARQRDNYKCRSCNIEAKEVHHLIPFRLFTDYKEANELSNLITLCQSCHRIADVTFNKLYPEHSQTNLTKYNECTWCNNKFKVSGKDRKVCSKCKTQQCKICLTEFTRIDKNNIYCSSKCMYDRNKL